MDEGITVLRNSSSIPGTWYCTVSVTGTVPGTGTSTTLVLSIPVHRVICPRRGGPRTVVLVPVKQEQPLALSSGGGRATCDE